MSLWNQTPEECESFYRKDPTAFRKALNAETESPPEAAAWRARMAADEREALTGATDESSTTAHRFTYAIAVSVGIALLFLVPYWVTGEMEPNWAVPFLAPLALVPMLVFHGWRRSWIV